MRHEEEQTAIISSMAIKHSAWRRQRLLAPLDGGINKRFAGAGEISGAPLFNCLGAHISVAGRSKKAGSCNGDRKKTVAGGRAVEMAHPGGGIGDRRAVWHGARCISTGRRHVS